MLIKIYWKIPKFKSVKTCWSSLKTSLNYYNDLKWHGDIKKSFYNKHYSNANNCHYYNIIQKKIDNTKLLKIECVAIFLDRH